MMSTPPAAPAGETLSRLVQTCRDAQTGYQFAANLVRDPILRAELLQYSGQRAEFVVDLQDALRGIGSQCMDPSTTQTPVDAHWSALKQPADTSHRAILTACQRAEVDAIDLYRRSLGAGLPMAVASMVHAQFAALTRVRDRLTSLIDNAATRAD